VSPDDVSPDEMSRFPGISHEDFERFLAGRSPGGDEALEDVERFVRDVRDAYPGRAVAHAVETEHLAAMMQAAGPLVHESEPVVRRTRDGLAREKSGWGSRGRSRVKTSDVKRRLLRSPVGRVAAVLVAMFTIFSGVALAGVLPAPVQQAVSDVAGSVGIHVPSPADADDVADDQGTDEQGDEADDPGEDEGNDAVVPQPGTDDEQEADDQGDQGDEQEADDQGDQGDDQGEDGDNQGEDGDNQGEEEQSGSDDGEESAHHSGPSESGEGQGSNNEGDGHDGDGSRGSDDEGDSHEGSDGGSGGSSGGDQGDDEGQGEG
jgi:hypothetical protein